MADNEMRALIVTEIMKLTQPPRMVVEPRPTVLEIEALMAQHGNGIQIETDGSVTMPDPHPRTVGDIADAVLRVVSGADLERARAEVAYWRAESGARLAFACALHKHAEAIGDKRRSSDIRVNDIMSLLAAFRDADAGEWHTRCEVCNEFLPDSEEYCVIRTDEDSTAHVHVKCAPGSHSYEGEPDDNAEIIARARAIVGETANG